jgi:hypothetical protein
MIGGFAGFLVDCLGSEVEHHCALTDMVGFDPGKGFATTCFIVIFTSFFGFLGFASLGNVNWTFLGVTLVACIGATLLGAYLMTAKLNQGQVNHVIGGVLFVAAAKMVHSLLKSHMEVGPMIAIVAALSLAFFGFGLLCRENIQL